MNDCLGCAGLPPDGGVISFLMIIIDNPLGIPFIITVLLVLFTLLRLLFLKEKIKLSAEKLNDVINVIKTNERGVHKRIDENRELLDLLQCEDPAFIKRCFWVRGWLASQDRFLCELADVSGVDNSVSYTEQKIYPRPFPKNFSDMQIVDDSKKT